MMGYIEVDTTREQLRKQSCQIVLNLVQTSSVKLKAKCKKQQKN